MNNLAFLFGCEEYEQETIPNLYGVTNDINSMSCALIENCDCSPEQIFMITDNLGNPTGGSILRVLFREAEKYSEEQIDNLFFYFSGHGCLSHDNKVCLITRDTLTSPIQHGFLELEEIIFALKQFKGAKHIILFFRYLSG